MPDRSAPIVVSPRACPFVALDGDRDRRLDTPDPLHRCFAEQVPRARSISHQAEYCLSPRFTTCPIFQDWASRAAAEPVPTRVPTTSAPTLAATASVPSTGAVSPTAPVPPTIDATPDAVRLRTDALVATRPYAPRPDEELTSSRPVPAYRATPQAAPGTPGQTPAATPVTQPVTAIGGPVASAPGDRTGVGGGPQASLDAGSDDDDVPVIRSIPSGKVPPALGDEDWMAPPPWLRQPTGPVWVAEAVPPPDALADIGTQGLRRPRPDVTLPAQLAEAAVPTDAGPGSGMPGSFGDETTGAPPRYATGVTSGPPTGVGASSPIMVAERVVGATTGMASATDAGTSAEVAAARYASDVIAGAQPEDDDDAADAPDARPTSRQRRVPIDVHASPAAGAHARPSSRSTGSREWEGPRRFEAYAATQRGRPPMGILVGGGAALLAVLLLGVFLLPGMLMGGGPAPTGTPAPATEAAVVVATRAPVDPTAAPERTERPEKTPKPRTYTVRSGDTLIRIAKRFKTTVAKIQCLNHIKNANHVWVGRTLLIPRKGYRCSDD